MNARDAIALLQPIQGRILGMVKVGVVRLVQEGRKLREMQLDLDSETTPDDYPHHEPYGLTSAPKPGAEAVVLHVGGERSVPIVLAVSDRRYRITTLEEGEVALYDDQGAYIKLGRTELTVEPAAGQELHLGEAATKEVGRVGDEVEVTIPAGSFLVAVAGPGVTGTTNPSDITVTGTITSGSATVRAVD